jgi:hypothetical protein
VLNEMVTHREVSKFRSSKLIGTQVEIVNQGNLIGSSNVYHNRRL